MAHSGSSNCLGSFSLATNTPSSEASASQRASAPCYGLAEDVLAVPVVVTPFKLGHVERQILRADVVERADDAALQQRPEAIDRACVDVPANVFAPAVVYALMDTPLAYPVIDSGLIGS